MLFPRASAKKAISYQTITVNIAPDPIGPWYSEEFPVYEGEKTE